MARISEAEIERLKSQISLSRLAEAKGVKLKPHGENLLGLCPFHDDREPSLVITPSKNLWHCLVTDASHPPWWSSPKRSKTGHAQTVHG